jgi:predicted transposase/invertase (TIGR01784 family)
MSKKTHHLHDKFVKASFSDSDRAISFFERFLPDSLLKEIDVYSLKVTQESYIQEDLSEHFSDIVFEVRTLDQEPVDLVLLFEHKSSPDKYVLIQVGHYLFSHYFKCISDKKPLKLIIPLIFYQGKKQWKDPNLSSLFPKLSGTLSEYIPTIKHIFIALRSLSCDNIENIRNGMMAAAVMAQRHAFDPIKLADDFLRIFTLFSETKDRGNFLEQLFVYVVNVSDITKTDLNKAIESIPSKIKDDIMTTYSRIRQEGEQIGRQEGEQIGRQEGEQIGIQKGELKKQIEIVIALFDDKIPFHQIAKYTNLTVDEIEKILRKYKKIS